jgi:Matrixin
MLLRVRSCIAVAAAAVASLIAVAEDARAFCRTTTSQVPAGYDPSASGCWLQGTPVAWTAGRVGYSLSAAASRQISLANATRVAHVAFDAWNRAPCPGGEPNVQTFDNGPVSADAAATDCGLNQCDPTIHDSQHVIVFRDDVWPHNDRANTLALTTVTFGVDSAEIFDADIEINSTADQPLSATEPPAPGTRDLQAILTHEAGHFYGLAHAPGASAIMFAYYKPGAVTLTQDDIDGVCAIYPPQPPGCGCVLAGGPAGSGLLAEGATLALLGFTAFRLRRRPFRWRRRTR